MSEDQKKDLTSLIDLSAAELAKNPHAFDSPETEAVLQAQAQEKVTEDDFGDLESLSKEAAAAAAHEPPPAEEPPAPALEPPPALEQAPIEQPTEQPMMSMVDSAPGEAPLGLEGQIDSVEMGSPIETASVEGIAPPANEFSSADAQPLPELGDLGLPPAEGSEAQNMIYSDALPGGNDFANADLGGDAGAQAPQHTVTAFGAPDENGPAFAINEGPPTSPQPVPAAGAEALDHTRAATALSIAASETPPQAAAPKTTLDPARPAVNAPPAGVAQAKKGAEPGANKQDLGALKKFGEKLAIGRPRVDASPPFSLMAISPTDQFDEKTIKAIEDAITSEDFGIRVDDIAIQLSAGKLLIPQISEFAAVTLAQKLRDVLETIDVDLATEIFKGSSSELSTVDDSFLMDTEEFEPHREEVHDILAEPRSADDLFSTNMPEVSEFQVTRILSVVMASILISPEAAEDPSSKAFEKATEELTRDLIAKAYLLGAHGILGINFTLKSIEPNAQSENDRPARLYRLLGSGTAVRVRKRASPAPAPQN